MKWRRLLSALSLLICTLCVVLKFWPSDRWQMFSVFVYLPPLLLIVWLVVHLLALGLHRWIALTLMLFIFTFSIWREHKAACAYSSGLATVRILHWNVWSLRKGVDRILQTIAEQKPDIICLNESKTSRNAPTYPPFAKRLHSLTGTELGCLQHELHVGDLKISDRKKEGLEGVRISGITSHDSSASTHRFVFDRCHPQYCFFKKSCISRSLTGSCSEPARCHRRRF